MTYKVVIADEAEAAILEAFWYVHERAPMNAARWLRDLYRQIDSLERFPESHGRARESAYLDEDLRQLIFKSHRIIFQVDKDARVVSVLHVRHAKQRTLGEPPEEE